MNFLEQMAPVQKQHPRLSKQVVTWPLIQKRELCRGQARRAASWRGHSSVGATSPALFSPGPASVMWLQERGLGKRHGRGSLDPQAPPESLALPNKGLQRKLPELWQGLFLKHRALEGRSEGGATQTTSEEAPKPRGAGPAWQAWMNVGGGGGREQGAGPPLLTVAWQGDSRAVIWAASFSHAASTPFIWVPTSDGGTAPLGLPATLPSTSRVLSPHRAGNW